MTTMPSNHLPEQSQAGQEQSDRRLLRWLTARRWDADFWLRYTVQPWLRDTVGPWTRRRVRDVERALEDGWSGTVAWIRALLGTIAGLIALVILTAAGNFIVAFWQHTMIGAHHSGVLATVTRPVHAYITAHAAGLPADPATIWALWQLAAPFLVLLAWLKSTTARTLWIAYGASWCAMVWTATPSSGQAIATALAAVCWAAVSAVALSGLDLRPVLVIPIRMRMKVKTGLPQKPSEAERSDI